jgi:hypothetical protein
MIDIFIDSNGILRNAEVSLYKAKNILSTQIGSLAYAPEFGIDYDLFFGDDYEIQTETFKSYAISKLAENGVNPQEILTEKETFEEILNIKLEN